MPNNGARIIIKSKYLKKGKNNSGGTGNYASYIGTREGAIRIAENTKNNPASESQEQFIDELLSKHPDLKNKIEFQEYKKNKTIGTASDFISEAIDEVGMDVIGVERYAQYMATRPGAIKIHDSGLFSDGDSEIDLEKIKDELKKYEGNVYTPIISLRPEDSIGYGYDNPNKWHELLERHRDEIAREYKITSENLRWVAAYHHAINKDGYVHNHVHMIIWSKDKNEGWQSKKTPEKIKSILAKDIFSQDENPIYQETIKELNKRRDEIRSNAKEIISATVATLNYEQIDKQDLISKEILVLANNLQNYNGRFYYNYLPRDSKLIVDNIIDDLFKQNENLQKSLEAWALAKDTSLQFYKTDHYEVMPASKVDDVSKPIKNQILKEVQNIINQSKQINIDTVCKSLLKDYLPQEVLSKNQKLPKKELRIILENAIPKNIPNTKNNLPTEFEKLLNYTKHTASEFNGDWKEANKQNYHDRLYARKKLINAFVNEYGETENNSKKSRNRKKNLNTTLVSATEQVNPNYSFKATADNIINVQSTASHTFETLLKRLPLLGGSSHGNGGRVNKVNAGIDEEELRRQQALEGQVHSNNFSI